ncbi:N-6 DNA methylase [Selenomonas ruminantium]|uniref:N-6 DNA Methylase n=1 Tax=Selenomonas ruminantium TaxID=971 RepID=A0A1H3VL60_SELRU|nr:N-6 DNA methylase [Selenomonas ruminantium]SDZ75479.1 N-6 DNA Methylase [Selenomonas ruminantium]
MGAGSLLLHARAFINEDCRNGIQFFGQEISHTTYNLARMNMILLKIPLLTGISKNSVKRIRRWLMSLAASGKI